MTPDEIVQHDLENERLLEAAFVLYGVTAVGVIFDGSGDSGQIEDISFTSTLPGFDADKFTVEQWIAGAREFDVDKHEWIQSEPEKQRVSLKKAIENLVNDELEESGVDWYNNDGGFGTWSWNGAKGIEFEINVRITDSELAYSEQRALGRAAEEDSP